MTLPDFNNAIAFLKDGRDFLVTSHVNADGDSIGSSLAMANILAKMGKSVSVVLNDIPESYSFLTGFGSIILATDMEQATDEKKVVLDCPSLNRLGMAENFFKPDTDILNIDHHKGNSDFGIVNVVSSKVCSTCEMLYHLCVAMDTTIDAELAEQLYTGILFDTGGFRYSLTTPQSHEAAAHLIRCGARFDYIADRIYNDSSLAELKMLGKAIDSMTLHAGSRLAVLHLTNDELRGGNPEEAVNYGMKIQTVEVAMFLKEEKPGRYRISLRSRGEVDVRSVAAAFGGGGHARAAGCRCEGSFTSVKTEVLAALERALP